MCDISNSWAIDEFDRLRRLVPDRPDWHLANWGRWRRSGNEVVRGYPKKSAGMECGGISSDDAFEHLCDDADAHAAQVCDAVIDGMDIQHRTVISSVYEASVWRSGRNRPLDDLLIDAAERFWIVAKKRGLF